MFIYNKITIFIGILNFLSPYIMKKIIILSATLFTSVCFSQTSGYAMGGRDPLGFHSPNNGGSFISTPLSRSFDKSTTLGSKYIDETFKDAKVNNGSQLFKLRYNNFDDVFEYQKSPQELFAIDRNQNKEIAFSDGRKYFFKSYTTGKEMVQGYLLLVGAENPKVTIYKSQLMNFTPEKHGNGYNNTQQAEFKLKEERIFVEYNGKMIPFQKESDFAKAFPSHSKEIKTFLKEKNITPKSTNADLAKLQEYLISIL